MHQKVKPWPLWLLATVLLMLAACAPPAPAPIAPENSDPSASTQPATTELRPINVCKSALATENSPLLYAQENGLFAKHGLTANVIAIDGGPAAVAALIAGDVDICATAGSPIVAARVAGADVRLIAGIVNTYVYSLIVPPDIQTPDDLRGGAIAVSDFGSSSDTAARAALTKLGLEPDKDVTITPVGGQRDRLAALKAGAVQGTLLSPPQTGMADELGFKVLVDMFDLGIPFQHTAIASTGRFIDENPEVIESFLAAVVEALTAMQTDETGAKEIIASEIGLDPVADAALLDIAIQVNVRRYMNHKPYPTLDGIRTIMAEQAPDNPDVMKLQPEDVVDTRALEELDRQGLLDGLGSAPTAKLQPVRVCYSSVSGTQLPVWYAYEKGLFADYGLEVELQGVEGGDSASATLIAGESDICQGSPSAMVAAAVQGADVVTIAGLVNSSPYSLVVRPEIASVDDLRGAAIAVNSLNGSAAIAARAILEHFGLQADKDVAILAVGSQGERLAAMKAGAVQATLTSPPQTIEAKEMGFKMLLDTAELGLAHQHTTINTTRRYLSEHRPEAVAFMKAVIAALASFDRDEAGVKETLAKYLELDLQEDAASLDEAYTQLVKKYFVNPPYPTMAGMRAELDSLVADNPAAARFKPEDIVDTGIVQELEQSGFTRDVLIAHPHP